MNLKSLIPWKKENRPLARQGEGDPFLQLQRRMNGLFDDFFGRSSSELWNGFGSGFAPQVDVSETGKEIRITAELPGLDEKDVTVEVSGHLLTIRGEKKEEQEQEKGNFWHSERSYGYFERSIELPPGIDADRVAAKFKKGVLKVTILRKPGAENGRRKIELLNN